MKKTIAILLFCLFASGVCSGQAYSDLLYRTGPGSGLMRR